jgi:hypothetical protein
VDRTAALVHRGVDRRLVGEVEVNGLDARQLDLCVVHHDDLGTGVLDELGGRRAHAGGAADDQRPLAVIPECVGQAHVIAPW